MGPTSPSVPTTASRLLASVYHQCVNTPEFCTSMYVRFLFFFFFLLSCEFCEKKRGNVVLIFWNLMFPVSVSWSCSAIGHQFQAKDVSPPTLAVCDQWCTRTGHIVWSTHNVNTVCVTRCSPVVYNHNYLTKHSAGFRICHVWTLVTPESENIPLVLIYLFYI